MYKVDELYGEPYGPRTMDRLVKDFHDFVRTQIKDIKAKYETYKSDKNKSLAGDYAKKFTFLKSKSKLPYFDDVLKWESIKGRFKYEEDILPFIEHTISKTRGIYKHGQTEKTGLCNIRILSNIDTGRLTIAIAKNTLDAKQQWEGRLIKSLKEKYPMLSLKDIILVISSKKNDLNGNATHCKNIHEAISHFSRGDFKIIFICSNNTRISDILTFLEFYEGQTPEKCKPIDIQHDEAHNKEEGVPSKRDLIEHIIIHPAVESYVPVSASYEPLIDEASSLWIKANLDMYAIDYTKNSDTISTSDDYSSIVKANQLNFETMKCHPQYTDHEVKEFDEETFIEGDSKDYTGWSATDIKADRDRRRVMEYCQFMRFEKEAANLGMNVLDNKIPVSYLDGHGTRVITRLIEPGVRNIHLITTPLRVVLTIHLMKYAISQDYNPLCIGLYRSEIHILYKNHSGQIISIKYSDLDECSSEELNNKLNDILESLVSIGESIERPIIIMGNYKPTGESITFVNYKYGTIRSHTLLPVAGLTKEQSYQGFLRCCYKDTKFRENLPDFTQPPKWIIGSQTSIDDALLYEKQNDERITRMKSSDDTIELVPVMTPRASEGDSSNISIPMKVIIEEMEDPLVVEYRAILAKGKRTKSDKETILSLLHKMIHAGVASYEDPSGKFHFETFTLKDVRCWKKPSAIEIEEREKERGNKHEDDWRFPEYDSNHRHKSPYINNKAKIGENECELYAAYDKYENGGFVHHKRWLWISYRHAI